jgi:hypothetical protein
VFVTGTNKLVILIRILATLSPIRAFPIPDRRKWTFLVPLSSQAPSNTRTEPDPTEDDSVSSVARDDDEDNENPQVDDQNNLNISGSTIKSLLAKRIISASKIPTPVHFRDIARLPPKEREE